MQKKLATYVLLFFGSGYRSMPGEGHTVVFAFALLSDRLMSCQAGLKIPNSRTETEKRHGRGAEHLATKFTPKIIFRK